MKQVALTLLGWYQWTRQFRTPACRFYPSCSTYTYQAIESHGLLRGIVLGSLRLLCCHPLHPGGVDLVPKSRARRRSA